MKAIRKKPPKVSLRRPGGRRGEVRGSMEQGEKRGDDLGVVLDQEAEYKRQERVYNRRQYRNAILRAVITFFAGAIVMALLETFGLGCFLFGLALFFLGSVFIKFF